MNNGDKPTVVIGGVRGGGKTAQILKDHGFPVISMADLAKNGKTAVKVHIDEVHGISTEQAEYLEMIREDHLKALTTTDKE